MIILLSNDKKIIKQLKKDMENVCSVDNMLDCQLQLGRENAECDILIIDWELIKHLVGSFSDWIIQRNSFIKHIIFYDDNTQQDHNKDDITRKLKRAQYKLNFITKSKLMEGLKNYEQ